VAKSRRRTAGVEWSEQRIRSLLDTTFDAIITIDSEGIIETFSAGAEQLFGYTAEEAIKQKVNILMPSPYREEHDDYLRRYLETGEPHVIGRTRDVRARRKDGTEFPIQISVSEIDHSGVFTGVIHDISEKRELEDEIVKIATVEQRRIGQELHDDILQNLTGLSLLTDNLCEVLKEQGHDSALALAQRIAAGISETHRHARLLAKGLLPIPITADELISALEGLARSTEDQHGITCYFEGSATNPFCDDTSAMHIFRMAQEAVTNAVRHAKSNEISIRLEDKSREIVLTVADNGIGIDNVTDNSSGLGLRIMRHRCGILGGIFSIGKQPNGGTAVVCRIPKAQPKKPSR
jgi:two-component system CheB/CheR fusion protein